MVRIQWVFFDFGGTLVDIKPRLYREVARRIASACGIALETLADVDTWVLQLKDAEKTCLSHIAPDDLQKINTDEAEHKFWLEHYCEVLGYLGVPRASWDDLAVDLAQMRESPTSFYCFSDVWEILGYLQKKGVHSGIISNAFPSAEKILDYLGLKAWFKPVVLSYEEKSPKPDAGIYHRAVDLAKILPWEALFVDDRPAFVVGAEAVQMHSLLLDRHGQYTWEGKKITTLNGLKSLLSDPVELSCVLSVGEGAWA